MVVQQPLYHHITGRAGSKQHLIDIIPSADVCQSNYQNCSMAGCFCMIVVVTGVILTSAQNLQFLACVSTDIFLKKWAVFLWHFLANMRQRGHTATFMADQQAVTLEQWAGGLKLNKESFTLLGPITRTNKELWILSPWVNIACLLSHTICIVENYAYTLQYRYKASYPAKLPLPPKKLNYRSLQPIK